MSYSKHNDTRCAQHELDTEMTPSERSAWWRDYADRQRLAVDKYHSEKPQRRKAVAAALRARYKTEVLVSAFPHVFEQGWAVPDGSLPASPTGGHGFTTGQRAAKTLKGLREACKLFAGVY